MRHEHTHFICAGASEQKNVECSSGTSTSTTTMSRDVTASYGDVTSTASSYVTSSYGDVTSTASSDDDVVMKAVRHHDTAV